MKETTKAKIDVLRKWLEQNKVFFETIVTAALLIMSILVSITANSIFSRQASLMEVDREVTIRSSVPIFTYTSTVQDQNNRNDTDSISKENQYMIINTGGRITDVIVSIQEDLILTQILENDKYTSYGDSMLVPLLGRNWDTIAPQYNYGTQSFSHFDRTLNSLKSIQRELEKYKFTDSYNNVIKPLLVRIYFITYTDLLGERHYTAYVPFRGNLQEVEYDMENDDNYIILDNKETIDFASQIADETSKRCRSQESKWTTLKSDVLLYANMFFFSE